MTEARFAGGAFHASIEGGRAGVELWLRPEGVAARLDSGAELLLSYGDCQLELGGASGRMLFMRSRDRSLTLFSEAAGLREALLGVAHPRLSAELHQLAGRDAQRRRSAQRWTLGLLLGLSALLLLGYLGLRVLAQSATKLLPISVDEKLGALAISTMDLGGPVSSEADVKGPVTAIVKRLSAHTKSGFRFDVRVIDAPIVNAFALPGGPIVVYTGLLRAADGPEQVAGVLAHEMAHVTERHGLERVTQSLGIVAGAQLLFGDVTGLAALLVELFKDGTLLSYGRDQEADADRVGVSALARASIDPRALASFFRLLEKQQSAGVALPAWLSTHPALGERVREVEREATALGPRKYETLDVAWGKLRRRLGVDSDQPSHEP